MAEILKDENPRKDLYRMLLADKTPGVADKIKKYSFNQFEKHLLSNEDAQNELGWYLEKKGVVADPTDFSDRYIQSAITPPTPKPQPIPAAPAPVEEEEPYIPEPPPIVGSREYDAQLQAQYGGMSPTLGATFGGVPAAFETKAQKKQEQISPAFKAQQLAFEDVPIAEEQRRSQRQFAKSMKEQQQIEQQQPKGFFEDLGTQVKRGLAQGRAIQSVNMEQLRDAARGKNLEAIPYEQIAAANKAVKEFGQTQSDIDLATKEGIIKDAWDVVKALPGVTIESLSSLGRSGLEEALVGAGTGAAAGSVIPGLGTAAGGGLGAAAGMVQAGRNLEYFGTLMQELEAKGVDITDPAKLKYGIATYGKDADKTAITRANTIAAVESFLPIVGRGAEALAARVGSKVAQKPLQAAGKALTYEPIAGPLGGATGELAAQIASGQEIDPQAIALETGGESAATVAAIAKAIKSRKKQSVEPAIAPEAEVVPAEEVQGQGFQIAYAKTREEIPAEYRNTIAEIERPTTRLGRFGPMERLFAYKVPVETVDITAPEVTTQEDLAEEIPFEEVPPVTEEAPTDLMAAAERYEQAPAEEVTAPTGMFEGLQGPTEEQAAPQTGMFEGIEGPQAEEEENFIVEPDSELSQKILDNGEQVLSRLDAEKRIGDGERLFGFNEQDDSLVELSLKNLGAFPVDTIIAVRPEAIEEALAQVTEEVPASAPQAEEVVSAAPVEEAAPEAPAAPAPKGRKAPAPKAEIARPSRDSFPESQSNTRTPVTQKLLDYFADVSGIPRFTDDLSKGTYIGWLQNANATGYEVASKLNAPRQAFDIIAQAEKERSEAAAPAPKAETKQAAPVTPAPAAPKKGVKEMSLEELKAESKVFDEKIKAEKERLKRIAPTRQIIGGADIENLSESDAARYSEVNDELARRTTPSQEEAKRRVAEKREQRRKEQETPTGKQIDKKSVQASLDKAKEEYEKAKGAFDKKRSELDKTTREDVKDLFGERKVEMKAKGLFEMPRISPEQREKAIQPFRDRMNKAKEEVNRLTKMLEEGEEVAKELTFEKEKEYEQVQGTGKEARKGKGAPKAKGVVRPKAKPVRNAGKTPDAIAARNITFYSDPFATSLQYLMDATYHPNLLESIFGGPSRTTKSGRKDISGERKVRIQFLDKTSNIKSADRLGEYLAERYAEENNIDVKDAEEQHDFASIATDIISSYSSRSQMVRELLRLNEQQSDEFEFMYNPEGIYGEGYNEDIAKEIDGIMDELPDSYWEGREITDEEFGRLFAEEEAPETKEGKKAEAKEEKVTPTSVVSEKDIVSAKIKEIAEKFKSIESELKGEIDIEDFSDRLRKRYEEIKNEYGEAKANEVLKSESNRADKIIKETKDGILNRLKGEYFKKNGFAPSSIRDFQKGIDSGEYKIDDLPSYKDAVDSGIVKGKEQEVAPETKPAEKRPISLNDIKEKFGENTYQLTKKYIEKIGEEFTDLNRIAETADRILDLGEKSKTVAVAEALQYEIAYPDNWADLRKAIKLGGIQTNAKAIGRMLDVGVKLPSDIVELYNKSIPTSKQEGNASTEFDGMKKPSKIKMKTFDGKHGKGAFERMQNITQNFEDIMDGLSEKIKQDCL